MLFHRSFLLSFILTISFLLPPLGCTTTQVRFSEADRVLAFTQYSHYGLFGLIGSDTIDAKKVCMGSPLVKIKTYFSWEDLLFSLLTAMLYTPKSTKIWCAWPRQPEET